MSRISAMQTETTEIFRLTNLYWPGPQVSGIKRSIRKIHVCLLLLVYICTYLQISIFFSVFFIIPSNSIMVKGSLLAFSLMHVYLFILLNFLPGRTLHCTTKGPWRLILEMTLLWSWVKSGFNFWAVSDSWIPTKFSKVQIYNLHMNI